jgi:hypothetical protein
MDNIEQMEREHKALTERLAQVKAARAKAAREARLAAQRAEQDNHIAKMFAEHAEPFGVPRSVSDKAYALAWEHGHSSGYSEVENYFQDFAELARVAYETGYAEGRADAA